MARLPKDPRALAIKLCLAGDFAVGKTSLARRFISNTFGEGYVATLGAKVSSKEYNVGDPSRPGETRAVAAAIWDVMGQKGFREVLKDAFFFNVRGVLYVCDATRPETLAALDDWSESVTSVAGQVDAVVLLNKVDLPGARVSLPEAETFARKRGWSCLPTSAKTGENVEAAFRLVAQRFLASLAKA